MKCEFVQSNSSVRRLDCEIVGRLTSKFAELTGNSANGIRIQNDI